MKGYRSPSWFRMKLLRKRAEVKARMSKPIPGKSKKRRGR